MSRSILRRGVTALVSRPIGLNRPRVHIHGLIRWLAFTAAVVGAAPQAAAQQLVDPTLSLRVVTTNLGAPAGMAFIGDSDALVLDKQTGQVKRVDIHTGAVLKVVLDLSVNNFSERGLLGIALHPDFPRTPKVYLYHTERTSTGYPNGGGPNGLVPSSVGDTSVALATPLLGNRLDRFTWSQVDGGSLTFDKNLIRLRALQTEMNDPSIPALRNGNHDGGKIVFGRDEKLYVVIGDNGRRGNMQNLTLAQIKALPNVATQWTFDGKVQDDEFGGPGPDNAHFTGVVLRLNDDGSTPRDNPFFEVGERMSGEVGANIQKVFSYGRRNSFAMAFDPYGGGLWIQENGGRAFDEIGLVTAGSNGGWIQTMGPLARVYDFKSIELAVGLNAGGGPIGLQQRRYLADNIADLPGEAASRLYMLPGAHYGDPKFSWKHTVSPAGLGFVKGRGLGPQYEGAVIIGSGVDRDLTGMKEGTDPAVLNADHGTLFSFHLTENRRRIDFDDSALEDRVADNRAHDDYITEQSTIILGTNFGVVTDIQTGPNGHLYLLSLNRGTLFEISAR